MNLKRTLVDSLDDLASSRSSIARRSRALDALGRALAGICVPNGETNTTELNTFLQLQDGFEYNVASRLTHSISASLPALQRTADSTNQEYVGDQDELSTSRLIIQSLSILQGVALLHTPSKAFLGKKWCIQIFVDLLAISRHLSPTPLSSTTNTASTPSAPNGSGTLASSTIDTLLCILVDAPTALRVFEEADGVEVVVKMLKRTGVARDIRIKCLEFLYFYLMDETGEVALTPATKHSTFHAPATQDGPRIPTPFPSNVDASTSSYSPDSTPRTPRTPRKVSPHLALLRRDIDFVPVTPKKVQVARLGVGTPRTGPVRTPHSTRPGRTSPVDISVTPASPTKRHRITESPMVGLHVSESQSDQRRSTQEKKEILGSLLGNVDALVESVARSGIWGLG